MIPLEYQELVEVYTRLLNSHLVLQDKLDIANDHIAILEYRCDSLKDTLSQVVLQNDDLEQELEQTKLEREANEH